MELLSGGCVDTKKYSEYHAITLDELKMDKEDGEGMHEKG